MSDIDFDQRLAEFKRVRDRLVAEVGRQIIGQRETIDQMLATVFVRGHCLLVGVPGLAKTMMVRSLAGALDLKFRRVQFTPDLMPSDITGTDLVEQMHDGRRVFRFVEGPLFANIVLADEINRAPPKTQSALLEAMQEHQVTVGQKTWPLPRPFFVIATQNPIEQEGTYPLPEAQLDRFLFALHVPYPTPAEEERILMAPSGEAAEPSVPIIGAEHICDFQEVVMAVPVSRYVVAYVAKLVRATRPSDPTATPFIREMVEWGAGPRAGQHLILAGKAFAAMAGRAAVSLDDVRAAAVPVLRHRVATTFAAEAAGLDSVAIIERLLKEVPEPPVRRFAGAAANEG
ncbi:MAG: MoxR family ATPase [Planctomycetota bacterium]|nr:MoxR family ATPase [Planctomycetota bacterium]